MLFFYGRLFNADRAKTLGFRSHNEASMVTKMAGSEDNVREMIDNLIDKGS